MAAEMRGGMGLDGGGGGGGLDPSNLHLRKELTQIKKASRVLRDPGTTSSWRSPLSFARSPTQVPNSTKQHYHHHHHHIHQYMNNSSGNNSSLAKQQISGNGNGVENNSNLNNNDGSGNGKIKEKEKEKEKKIYLYNWRMQRSGSEKSRQRDDIGNGNVEGSSSTPEESVDDSLSDARYVGNDSKSDTYVSDRYASMILKCKDANFMPSIRRAVKKKSKKNNAVLRRQNGKLQREVVFGRGSERLLNTLPGLGVGKDDSISLADRSDDTEEYYNSEDLRKGSVTPLLARLKSRNWGCSSVKLRDSRKEDSSYTYSTPALSTGSFRKYHFRNPSTVGSWDGTTASLNDGDNEVDDPFGLPGRRGCGIPCYWSRRSTPRSRGGCGSFYSPSLSDTLKRKGSSIFCGSHSMYQKRRHGSSIGYNKNKISSRNAGQGLIPLLTNSEDGRGGSSIGSGNSDDELSTNGELDLEALSRLDGRRWSTSCRSQEGLELVALNGKEEEEGIPENIRSLSRRYRPMFFDELIGQNIVVQSLINAISRGRIAPVYLFQGPRGTGKTSTARVFAAALNCLATEETKPCGVCRECTDFISGKSGDIGEVDGADKKGIDRIKYLLKNLSVAPSSAFSRYQVFAVDKCHLLPPKTWMAFLKFLEEPPQRVVFVLMTTDLDNLPRTVLSRCQKYLFNKIKDSDIVTRLRKIASEENLDVESEALHVIALNADGSFRDAETMLEQLSLLGKRITASLVNELVGVVSDEKLLELLELAMSSDTAETVKRARELLDSGVDPTVLMSQLASLIMDIIAGTRSEIDAEQNDVVFSEGKLTEMELDRLKHALKLLSEAEKQLRDSSERSTWFTATLLQLGSQPTPDPTHSGSSRRQSSRATEEDPSSTSREAIAVKQRPDAHRAPRLSDSSTSFPQATYRKSISNELTRQQSDAFTFMPTLSQVIEGQRFTASQDDSVDEKTTLRNSQILDNIWTRCIEKCHSKTLRQLLHTYGKLVSISQVKGVIVAHVAFLDSDIKTRAERFLSSITNSFELVLRSNVEVRIILLAEGGTPLNRVNPHLLPDSLTQKQMENASNINGENAAICSKVDAYSDLDLCQEPLIISRGSFDNSEGRRPGVFESIDENANTSGSKERKPEIPVQRIESIIREQRLETAWLQAMDKSTPGSLSHLKLERNQILPQDGIYHRNQMESMNFLDFRSPHWEDELNREINSLKITDGKVIHNNPISRRDQYPLSPSLLHDTGSASNFSKDSMGYESGSGTAGCGGLLCWKNRKPRKRVQVKQGTPVRSHRSRRFLWFGECGKSRRSGIRFRR